MKNTNTLIRVIGISTMLLFLIGCATVNMATLTADTKAEE